jgi:hypothetical protein
MAGYDVILAKPFENQHLLSQIPDFYDRLKKSYDETFYQQEVIGSYLSLTGGKVYSSFSREDHVTELERDPRYALLWALDFNVDPMSSVVVQVVGGKIRVLGEIVLRHSTTMAACAEFMQRYPRHDAGVIVYGDASGHQQQTTGMTDYETVRACFQTHSTIPVQYRTARSNPNIRDRVNLTNSKLRSASGAVSLLVDASCKELIKDFEQIGYKPDSNVVDKDRDRMRTHLSDALGYLLWQEFRTAPSVGERKERIL